MKYHEIGEIFEHDGVLLEVVPSPVNNWIDECSRCYFYNTCTHEDIKCTWGTRKDGANVVFKRVKKPIKRIKIPFERIKLDVLRKNLKDMEQKEVIEEKSDERIALRDKETGRLITVKGKFNDEDLYESFLNKLFTTYKAKNHDYSGAFTEMFDELGIDYAYGKLREKINRIKVLRNQPNMVENEGLEDALLDTAGYAILTLVELKKRSNDTH